MRTFKTATFPSTDVLVIGAGPAGSACARVLARSGVNVLLVDQHPQGRDKTCGDGLIPDAHKALARLGLLDTVMRRAEPVAHVGCIGPRGGRVDVPGSMGRAAAQGAGCAAATGGAGRRWRAALRRRPQAPAG